MDENYAKYQREGNWTFDRSVLLWFSVYNPAISIYSLSRVQYAPYSKKQPGIVYISSFTYKHVNKKYWIPL